MNGGLFQGLFWVNSKFNCEIFITRHTSVKAVAKRSRIVMGCCSDMSGTMQGCELISLRRCPGTPIKYQVSVTKPWMVLLIMFRIEKDYAIAKTKIYLRFYGVHFFKLCTPNYFGNLRPCTPPQTPAAPVIRRHTSQTWNWREVASLKCSRYSCCIAGMMSITTQRQSSPIGPGV